MPEILLILDLFHMTKYNIFSGNNLACKNLDFPPPANKKKILKAARQCK